MSLQDINKPTLLLDAHRTQRNIRRMAEKARLQGVNFRPHFKTHQSAVIGAWFRQVGVSAITVSSVDMALYFARHGWDDITIAFPVNLRQAAELEHLASTIRLGLLVESPHAAEALQARLKAPLRLWIEVDEGSRRSGLSWEQPEAIYTLAQAIQRFPQFHFEGLLTHAGRIYGAASLEEIKRIHGECVERMNHVRHFLVKRGIPAPKISIGDTPGCTIVEHYWEIDEIRPGNFVFYDAMQLRLGVCSQQDVAVGLACPVVALYPERQEVVIYGGAVHLSKDHFFEADHPVYGYVALTNGAGWGECLPGAYVARVSQEHGVVHLPERYFPHINLGDLLVVIPAHSCLVVSALGEYLTLVGQNVTTFLKGDDLPGGRIIE